MTFPEICFNCKRAHMKGKLLFSDPRLPQPRPDFHSDDCRIAYMREYLREKPKTHPDILGIGGSG